MWDIMLAIAESGLEARPTTGYLGEKVCGEETSRYVREFIGLEPQIFVKAHDSCILFARKRRD